MTVARGGAWSFRVFAVSKPSQDTVGFEAHRAPDLHRGKTQSSQRVNGVPLYLEKFHQLGDGHQTVFFHALPPEHCWLVHIFLSSRTPRTFTGNLFFMFLKKSLHYAFTDADIPCGSSRMVSAAYQPLHPSASRHHIPNSLSMCRTPRHIFYFREKFNRGRKLRPRLNGKFCRNARLQNGQ